MKCMQKKYQTSDRFSFIGQISKTFVSTSLFWIHTIFQNFSNLTLSDAITVWRFINTMSLYDIRRLWLSASSFLLNIAFRSITQVKQCRTRPVLRWEPARKTGYCKHLPTNPKRLIIRKTRINQSFSLLFILRIYSIVISLCVLNGFEIKVFLLLDWYPPKTIHPSLHCYLTLPTLERRNSFILF